MNAEEIRQLYDYNAWANRRLFDACEPLKPEQFTRDLHSSFPSVRDTLVHILGAECLWYERFQGRHPKELLSAAEFHTLGDIRRRALAAETDLLKFIGGLTREDLARIFEFRTIAGELYPSPLWQALQHLVNHGSYHRGQVTAFLRQLGAQPVSLDLIRFYRERAAAAGA
jgi:uncharacterized damage-inducible protein DinB